MKKHFHSFIILFLFINTIAMSQAWQWAFTTGIAPRSQTVAAKRNFGGSGALYLATYTDSGSIHVSTQIDVWDPNINPIFQFQIPGNVAITDLEFNAANHPVVTGYFTGTITIDTTTLTSINPSENSGFIFEMGINGGVLWAHDLNPVGGDFKPGDLFIASNGMMYLTSQVSGTFGFCAFHQLDAQGTIIRNEFNNNFENRTYTNVLADSVGNVYISGTCGNGATFDSINANANFSYQNFLVKYDSTLKAQWFKSRNYITFDDNNSLVTDGENMYWAFDDFSFNTDTVKIIKFDNSGQVTAEVQAPLSNAFFPAIDFAVDRFGNGVLAFNIYTRIFVYRYDTSFNIVWQDTLMTQTSGFPFHDGLVCYDSSFYLSAAYLNDTLMIDNFTLLNPNAGTNYPSDIFIAKWGSQSPVSIYAVEVKNNSLSVFPNPVKDDFTVCGFQLKIGDEINIFDAMGNTVYTEQLGHVSNDSYRYRIIQTFNLSNGIYFLNVMSDDKTVNASVRFVVMH